MILLYCPNAPSIKITMATPTLLSLSTESHADIMRKESYCAPLSYHVPPLLLKRLNSRSSYTIFTLSLCRFVHDPRPSLIRTQFVIFVPNLCTFYFSVKDIYIYKRSSNTHVPKPNNMKNKIQNN